MERITIKHLRALAARLNTVTGSPAEYAKPYVQGVPFCANIGNYHIDQAYGGFMLARVSNTGGAISCPLTHGHIPARELYERMHAFLAGYDAATRGAE